MIQFWIICGYLGLLLLLGIFASRLFKGTSSDYQLASHSIGPFLLLMSLFGTTMTAFALVGSSGEAFKAGVGVYGMMASSSGIVHSLCFFLVGVPLWRLGKKYNYTTQISYFRDRLDSDNFGLLLFPILIGLIIPYLLIGVLASGKVIQVMTAGAFKEQGWFETANRATSFGLPPWIGALAICIVVLTYVFMGGMRGTAWANAFQTIVFMVLGVVTFFIIANQLGKGDTFFESLKNLGEAIPKNRSTRMDMSQTRFLTYFFIPLSVGMFPHLFQHWLTAKSANSFKLSIVIHPIFIMIVWVPCVLIGLWATTSLVPPKPPLPGNSNAILPFLVKTQVVRQLGPMGAWLGGLLTAGILAAIMSSLDSQFLCVGTMFTNDIVTHYKPKESFTDKQIIWISRGFIIAIVAVTYLISIAIEGTSVFAMAIWCFTGFASLFPLIFAALYWKGLTKFGAYACVIVTACSWFYFFKDAKFGGNREYTIDYTLFGKTFETMPVATIFVCSVVTLVVVSLITPKPKEATLKKFFAS